jgi:dTDP-4-dehydrorhamnose 3,5-epimerase-like enzyme
MTGLSFIETPSITGSEDGGILRVYEHSTFPIEVQRVFTVTANKGAERGRHAHKRCTQVLSCVSGSIELTIDDGFSSESYRLTTNSESVLIPPGIWAEQRYTMNQSVLLVLCDTAYDEDDYLRDYSEFLEWKRRTE